MFFDGPVTTIHPPVSDPLHQPPMACENKKMKNVPSSVDRREFLKCSAGAAAATTVALNVGGQAVVAKEKRAVSKSKSIMVNQE